MKGRSRVYRADDTADWSDLSIAHSRRVKVGRGGSVLQYAGGPSSRRTQRVAFEIPDSHIPQEVLYDQNFPHPEPPESKKIPAKCYVNSDRPMHEWQGYEGKVGYREEYLLELLRRNGRGGAVLQSACSNCQTGKPIFRCDSCPLGLLACKACCLKLHLSLPLHVVQEWMGERFVKTTLRELGLQVQIGHFDGSECICPEPAGPTFTILDTNGIHDVEVDYCACDRREGTTRRQQLLRFGWYPATPLHPRTCATLTLLDQFHALTHVGKISTYDYYRYLNTMTDAWGIRLPKRKYTSLLQMVCQYRHLKMLMRAGRGQEENGIATTSEGQLALRCPACPIPEVNLPEGWRLASRSISYLYCGIFAMDANFRLKNLFRSTFAADPGLHTGLAYFVKYAPYASHLAKYVTQTDMSFGFKTLEHAESKGETGLRASGVAMCVCATGVGDLQKGERYANMDYIIMSGISSLGLQNIFVSYDIACQWNINFTTQNAEMPQYLQLRGGEMGPGSQHDTLDDHFAYHNFIKMIGLGNMLHKRLTEAEIQVEAHRKYHNDFTNALPKPEYKAEWTTVVKEWDQDRSKPSPYLSVGEHMSEQQLKLKLKEDKRRAKARGDIPVHKISATSCLGLGLLIEDSQRRITAIVSGEGMLSSSELADVEMRRMNLDKQIEQFRELQVVYMLGIALRIEQEREAAKETIEAEDDKLWFPSDLSERVRNTICHPGLGQKEEMLHEAQCWDALAAIHSLLRAEASVHDFRNANLRGQEALLHVSDVLDAWKRKQELAAMKYQRARSAILALRGTGPWMHELRELHAKDMLSMYSSVLDTEETGTETITPEDQRQKKKKTDHKDMPKEVSWIWLVEGSLGELQDDSDVTDVRVHWLRSRARLKRWEEEVSLLREEQWHVLVTLRYRAKWWDSRRSGWEGLAPEIAEGLQAYAAQQRNGQLALATHFCSKWPCTYIPPPDDEFDLDDDTA
ncbi:hypothetical protein EV421DRAFT_1910330 [Armillaria borealis]|uniref:CxC2-like cysteine cluster KDZ transposase-associated domain-containing protein n=1 Tax=Armillaria borealis TaxID=47425 RepID=A0AA39J1N3_9AGAR|nr:hypothetical protein EV421DRAFT_1910330 [Armillaria borealis]